MAAVSFHPIASRSGEQSSTVVSVQVAEQERGQAQAQQHSAPTGPVEVELEHPSDADLDRVYGIEHADIDAYPIFLDEPTHIAARCGGVEDFGPAPPIRAMTAEQFAELHAQYAALETPHNVLFPFLHGVDGNNAAQNSFFGAPAHGQPTPHYRGLTVVRADMPRQEQPSPPAQHRHRASSSASALSMTGSNSHGAANGGVAPSSARCRADSVATSCSSARSCDSHGSSCEDDDCSVLCDMHMGSYGPGSASSASISSASMTSGGSYFSHMAGSEANSSHTSISSIPEGSVNGSHKAASSNAHGRSRSHRLSAPHDPQPRHSLLNSTLLPNELVVLTSVVIQDAQSPAEEQPPSKHASNPPCLVTAAFREPDQPKGISLRNFRIQAIKYATISDVVIYCPSGLQGTVIQCARKFREAQELQWRERLARGLGGLRYNVFIVTEPFSAFERFHPHLVAVDGAGNSRGRVDFIEREREEMQRLTAASEIDDNVWLGCSADVPRCMSDEEPNGAPPSLPRDANPLGFSVCVEANECNEIPSAARLAHASHYLDAIEATAVFELNSKEALRELEEDDSQGYVPSDDDERGLPSLGPQGWSPSMYSRSKRGRVRKRPSNVSLGSSATSYGHQAVIPPPESIVHLEGPSSGSLIQSQGSTDHAVETIVQLCAWIKRQAQPRTGSNGAPPAHAAAANTSSSSSSFGLLHSAFRGRGSHSPVSNRSSAQPQARQHPRRILIHCPDGYTETSMLALAYLMYSRGLTLPEAYLDLQLRCQRSFFVYNRDVPFLRLLERRIQAEHEECRAREQERERERERGSSPSDSPRSRSKHSFSWSMAMDFASSSTDDNKASTGGTFRKGGLSSFRNSNSRRGSSSSTETPHVVAREEGSVWQRGLAAASGLVSSSATPLASTAGPAPGATSGYSLKKHGGSGLPSASSHSPHLGEMRTRTPTPRGSRNAPASPQTAMMSVEQQPQARPYSDVDMTWFSDPRFEGCFPSRILPFVYLGNLNHALNPSLLHALGITHVVSVGETALHPPPIYIDASSSPRPGHPDGLPSPPQAHNSLWKEEREGRISVLDLKNVADDGIDSLQPSMQRAVEYMEEARRAGGSVLVHCRVGVSRSASVVIAYVMAHLDLNLVESYLLVRSRRLNILIQPSLLLLHDLRNFEAFLAKQKAARIAVSQPESSRTSSSSNDGESLGSSMTGLRLASEDAAAAAAAADCTFDGTLSSRDPKRNASRSPPRLPLPPLPWKRSRSADKRSDSPAPMDLSADEAVSVSGDGDRRHLNVDLGVGAGLIHSTAATDTSMLPFGSGSPSGLSATSMRLTWGHLCREIAALNERYSI